MKGDIWIKETDVFLDLGGGREVVFDLDDLSRVNQHRWSYSPPNGRRTKGYAQANVDGKTVYLHRFVMKAVKGEEIDHRDHNGLNDRKSNLRRVTHSENLHNASGAQRNSKTGVLGVHPEMTRWGMRYFAVVEKDGKAKRKLFPYTDEGLRDAKAYVEHVRAIALSDPASFERMRSKTKPPIICRSCGKQAKHKALGMCKPCYERDYKKKHPR